MRQIIEKATNVGIEYPIHLLPHKPDPQRVQRIACVQRCDAWQDISQRLVAVDGDAHREGHDGTQGANGADCTDADRGPNGNRGPTRANTTDLIPRMLPR